MLKVIIKNNYEDRDAGTLTYTNDVVTFDGPDKDQLEFMLQEEKFHWVDDDGSVTEYSIEKDPIAFMTNLYRLLTGSRFSAELPEFIDTGIKRAIK